MIMKPDFPFTWQVHNGFTCLLRPLAILESDGYTGIAVFDFTIILSTLTYGFEPDIGPEYLEILVFF